MVGEKKLRCIFGDLSENEIENAFVLFASGKVNMSPLLVVYS